MNKIKLDTIEEAIEDPVRVSSILSLMTKTVKMKVI